MDAIDQAILLLLENDGRLGYEEVATHVRVSRATATERMTRLLASGRIEVRGVAHPDVLNIGAMAYVTIAVDGAALPVADAVAQLDLVPFVSVVTGPHPVSAEIRGPSAEAIAHTVATIRALPGVQTVETTRYIELVRDVVGPVGALTCDVDRVDRRIISELERDGRLTYVEIARRVGRSATSVRHRMRRLIEGNAVDIGAVVRHDGPDGLRSMGAGIRLVGADEVFVQRLRQSSEVFFVARALGRFDIVLTARARGAVELLSRFEEIRSWPEVRSAETWMHLRVVKESYATPVVHTGLTT